MNSLMQGRNNFLYLVLAGLFITMTLLIVFNSPAPSAATSSVSVDSTAPSVPSPSADSPSSAPPTPSPSAASAGSAPTALPSVSLIPDAVPASSTSPIIGNTLLTHSQQLFAIEFSSQTKLDVNVVAAWCLNEQSSNYAAARELAGNQNWLDIGYTDSANRGTSNSYWFSGPEVAARVSADWMKGKLSIDGFGRAAPGIVKILDAAGKSPEEQIRALQVSPWASGHYPHLQEIYGSILASNPEAIKQGRKDFI